MASVCLMLSQNSDTSDQMKNGSRPSSYYDNYLENGGQQSRSDGKIRQNKDKFDSPSQTHCLNTTVPQNIAGQNIGGKHTPTRSSLRHSRMIVLNRHGRIPQKYLPAIIRCNRLAKGLKGFVTLFGTALCFLSAWLLIWAQNLRNRDNPSYSAVPVLFSGIIGLVYLCCCRKEYPGAKRSYIVYTIKVISICLSAVAIAAALTACVFAMVHLISLSSMTCEPPDNMNKTCVCYLQAERNNTIVPIRSYHYIDLSCAEVDNVLVILLVFSCSTNLLAALMEIWYVYLHWASRYTYVFSKNQTAEEQKLTEFNDKS